MSCEWAGGTVSGDIGGGGAVGITAGATTIGGGGVNMGGWYGADVYVAEACEAETGVGGEGALAGVDATATTGSGARDGATTSSAG